MSLTKDELIHIKPDEMEIETVNGTVKIRCLTSQEISHIQEIRAVGTITTHNTDKGTETNTTVEMSEYVRACQEAKLTAIMYSLSVDENWNIEEVKNIPVPLANKIYTVISEWNQLGEE